MGYNTSNAALAYDMNAMPAYREAPQAIVWSEWRESNSRPLEPHSSALPNCATPGRTGLSQVSLIIIANRE